MPRRLALFALAALVTGCPSGAQQQYVVRRANLSCDDANRYAFDTMKSLGYAVGQFRLAKLGEPGQIKATRTNEHGTDRVTVDIRCEAGGIEASGTKDESLLKDDVTFSRGFFLAFSGLADHGPELAAYRDQQSGGTTGGGAKLEIRPQIGLETKLDFGEDLAGAGILAVKVAVQNGSDRTYRLDPAEIEVRTSNDDSVVQIPLAAAAAALAKASAADAGPGAPPADPARMEGLLRGRALVARTLRPGDRAEGFVYFPTGSYVRARATLIDTATDEGEGFLVEF